MEVEGGITEGYREQRRRRISIPSWSGPDLPWRKTELKLLPASLPSLDTENCPPLPHCTGPIPGVTVLNSKLRNKNLVPGANIHLCCVLLPNSVTAHLHIICSLISPSDHTENYLVIFQSRSIRRKNNKKQKTHNLSQVEGGSHTLHLGDVC